MKGRILYSSLLVGLFVVGLLPRSVAQSIVTNAVSPGAVCAGGEVEVPFTTTGAFTAGNVFSAQISDINGAFPANPTVIGRLTRSPTGPITASIQASIPATLAASTAYRVRVVSSNPVRTSTNSQPLTVKAVPGVPGTTTPDPYCEGATASPLVATPSAGGVLQWYGSNPNGAPSTTPTIPNTTLVGSTPYYVSQSVSGCEGPQATITVVVRDSPNAPGTSPKSYCVGDVATPLSASPVAGATLTWYSVLTGGAGSPVAPTPGTTTPGSVTYYVSQTVNGCESPRASLVVTVNARPAAPAATTPAPTCQGAPTAPLTATPEAGATLRWWGTSATGGTFSATPTVPGNQASATYYVSQEKNGCDGPRTAITVTIKPLPTVPTTTPAPSYCQNAPATPLVATPSAGGTLGWYGTNATGGSPSATPSTPGTTLAGTANYYVSQTVNGCESNRAAIPVVVKPTPGAPVTISPTNLCQNRTASPLSAQTSPGGTLNWYGTDRTGGTASPTAPTPPTTATGTTVYYVSQSVSGCEGPRASTSAVVYAVPAQPATTPPNPYCEGTSASPLAATGQSLRWYGTNATGGSASTTPTVPSTNQIGTANYYVTQTTNGCESDRAAIPVLVKDTPVAPSLSGNDFCQNYPATTLAANLVSNASVNWYTAPNGGNRSDNPPTVPNNEARSYTYYASQTLDGCEGPRASATVRVKATPGIPSVNPVSFCNNSQAQQLVANGNNGFTIKWYDASDRLLDGAPIPTTNNVGDQVFKATQTSNEGCESQQKATLVVTIKPLPAPPGVANLNYCQSQADQPNQNVTALTANGQDLRWYNPDGNAYSSAPTPPISQTGVTNFQVSQTVNGCEGGKATLQVAVRTAAAPAVARPLLTYCINEKAAPLQATGETGGSLRWIDPYGRVTPEAPTPPTLNVNVQPGGDAYYVYQIGANGCYSARSTIKIIVNTTPTLALVGSANINLGQRTPLRLTFTGAPPFSYTLTGGYSGIASKTDTTIQVLPRGNTTYQVEAVTNSCGVGLPGNPATAVVTVRVPTIATSVLASTTLCAGTALVVPFTTTGVFNNGNAFRAELISVADTTRKYEISTGINGSPVTGTLPITLPAGQYAVRVKASNPDVAIIGTNSPTIITVRSRPAVTLAGTQEIFEGVPASITFTFGGEGPWTLAYADSLRSYSVVTTTNPYIAEVRPSRTTTYRVTSLSNTCGTGPISGTATVKVIPLLGVEDPDLGSLVSVYPVPTASVLTVDIDVSLQRNPAVLSLTDQRGQPVLQQKTRSRQTQLDLNSQPPGIYLLRIQVGDRQAIRKILKE